MNERGNRIVVDPQRPSCALVSQIRATQPRKMSLLHPPDHAHICLEHCSFQNQPALTAISSVPTARER